MIREIKNRIRNTTKINFPAQAAMPATSEKPKTAAITAITRNSNAQRSIRNPPYARPKSSTRGSGCICRAETWRRPMMMRMDLQLHDNVILVTGGAKGIGEGIANVLAAEGGIPVIV